MSPSLIQNRLRTQLVIGCLLLFHLIGLILMMASKDSAQLSYLNLCLTAALIFIGETNYLKSFFVFIVIFLGGFLVEYFGVHTGIFFGNYTYGEGLGPKISDIPIVIGVNWYCIVMASGSLLHSLKYKRLAKAILAGILCTVFDFIIEPVAVKLDFWIWEDGLIPIWNYICWFGFSSLFAFIYLSFKPIKNKVAQSVYLIWLVFFSILNFVI